MDAMTAARGWSGLFSSLSKKGSTPVPIEAFLPYPNALTEQEGAFKPKTVRILHRLMKQGVIPPEMSTALNSIPQIKKYDGN